MGNKHPDGQSFVSEGSSIVLVVWDLQALRDTKSLTLQQTVSSVFQQYVAVPCFYVFKSRVYSNILLPMACVFAPPHTFYHFDLSTRRFKILDFVLLAWCWFYEVVIMLICFVV